MPVIIVLPGIATYVLYIKYGMFGGEMLGSMGMVDVNEAYPNSLNLLQVGIKGLAFAVLTAAIGLACGKGEFDCDDLYAGHL